MTIRVNTDLQAIYIHEPLGHTCPAMTAAWTVAGLYRMESDVNLSTLLAARYGDTAGTRYLGLFLDADGTTVRIRGNNGSASQSAGYAFVPGVDYKLALDYDGAGTARMLLDGVVVLTFTFTPTAGTDNERSLQFGGYGEVTGYTDCTVARWRMWSAVLTEAEHRAEYRSTVPVRTAGLLHDWPMVAGATRLNDTVTDEPDLAQNPAVPVGDGAPFVYRPSPIGTPQSFNLGQTTTPGAQAITVPEFAQKVAILFSMSDSADTPDVIVSSLASTFADTFTRNNQTPSAVSMGGSICVANVTSTGAGKTFTPVFSNQSIVAGVVAFVVFLQDVGDTWPTDFGFAQATGAGANVPGTANADGIVDGLALVLDAKLSTTSANYPANEAGWDSQLTGQSGPGTYPYYNCGRLRTKAITTTGLVSATTQAAVLASCVSLLTIPAGTLAGAVAGSASGGDIAAGTATPGVGVAVGAAGGDVAAGSAVAAADISIGGIGVAGAAGSAVTTVAVSRSEIGLAVSGGAAAAQATVTISALGLAQAAGSAGVSTSVLAAGAGAAQAAGNATLAAQIAAIAAGGAQAGGSATGSATSDDSASAVGGAVASGSAALTVSVQLQALGGAAAAGATTIAIDVAVTAAGFAQAMGAGVFSVDIPLSAFGGAQASGTATAQWSDGGPVAVVPNPRFIATLEPRYFEVFGTRRVLEVDAVKRNYEVAL